MQCTWGWNRRSRVQVCSTAVTPSCAPRRFSSIPRSSDVRDAAEKSMSKIIFRLPRASAPSSCGNVNTTWKQCVGRTRSIRLSIHAAWVRAWHLGQWRLRHELYAGREKSHESHTSTWPPRTAVRHTSIAFIARSASLPPCQGGRDHAGMQSWGSANANAPATDEGAGRAWALADARP
jgi:hypothetical protein